MLDTSDELLSKATARIEQSLGRVAKKKHADDASLQELYVKDTMVRAESTIQLTTLDRATLQLRPILKRCDL